MDGMNMGGIGGWTGAGIGLRMITGCEDWLCSGGLPCISRKKVHAAASPELLAEDDFPQTQFVQQEQEVLAATHFVQQAAVFSALQHLQAQVFFALQQLLQQVLPHAQASLELQHLLSQAHGFLAETGFLTSQAQPSHFSA
jgi:hypothetical protein